MSSGNILFANPESQMCVLHAVSGVLFQSLFTHILSRADSCMTSIFSGCWMCRSCGHEVCGDCYIILGSHRLEAPQKSKKDTRLRNPDQSPSESAKRKLLLCHSNSYHYRPDFMPVSRFSDAELKEAISKMNEFLTTRTSGPSTDGNPDKPEVTDL